MSRRVRCRSCLTAVLLAALATACGKAPSREASTTTYDVAEPGETRTASTTKEWSVGGLVTGKSVTTTTVTAPAPPVVEDATPPRRDAPRPQSGLLTAGDVDDLLNPGAYAAYAGRVLQAGGRGLPFVDPRTRVVVRVVDADGRPVPFARVELARDGAPLRLATAADGTTGIFPRFDRVPDRTTLTVAAPTGTVRRAVSLGGGQRIDVALPGRSGAPAAMDLALVIDTTGSMGDEMAYLRAELDSIVARLKRNAADLDLRIGVVLYRDDGDEYVVRATPLTGDVAAVRRLLSRQEADGGGDPPEAMERALAEAARLPWRSDAAKAVLLVTDAPPHEDRLAATIAAADRLRSQGVQIVPVAASGVEEDAQYVLRTAAVLTQGRYIFLTDDSGVGDPHAEPDVACYLVTRLDQAIARVLAGIATGRRVEPRAEDVVRRVETYDRGRCLPPRASTRNAP